MDKSDALTALSALSQDTRLDAFRLLVRAGSDGMTAGDIATHLDVRQNTMSSNLTILTHARLLRNSREGRQIRYFADMDGIGGLLEFLLEDCCGGQPALCQSLIRKIAQPCQSEDAPCPTH